MRIVVLGAGTVGTWIADTLCQKGHSVTVIDIDPEHTRRVNNELDVRVVTGSGSRSSVLFQADVLGADVFLALTGVDEVNIVAASMAKSLGVRRSVARVYAPIFRDVSTFDYHRHFHIDRLLSLEHLSALEIVKRIRNPRTVVMEHFARGDIEVLEVVVGEGAAVVGDALRDLQLPKGVRVGSISREGEMWIAGANDQLHAHDHVMLIGRREEIDKVKEKFRREPESKQGIVIAGGGETGYHLARTLEGDRFAIVLMESDPKRCEYLASNLRQTTIVNVDATLRSAMEEERVGSADFFVACTGDDENNIMAGVEARDLGASSILAIVGRPDYARLLGKLGIDLAVSPRNVMAHQVLTFLNQGQIVSRTELPGNKICVLEVEAPEGCEATQHVLANLELPKECVVVAVTREDFVQVPGADDRILAGDTVVVLVEIAVEAQMLRLFDGANQ